MVIKNKITLTINIIKFNIFTNFKAIHHLNYLYVIISQSPRNNLLFNLILNFHSCQEVLSF